MNVVRKVKGMKTKKRKRDEQEKEEENGYNCSDYEYNVSKEMKRGK